MSETSQKHVTKGDKPKTSLFVRLGVAQRGRRRLGVAQQAQAVLVVGAPGGFAS